MLEIFVPLAPRARLADQTESTLGELLFSGQARSLIRLLAVPVKPAPTWTLPVDGLHHAQSHHQHHQRIPLLEIPTELHWKLFWQIQRIEDVLSLGLAYPQFRDIARMRLQDHLGLLFGPWANQELVCVGENIEPDDFPPLFSPDEELKAFTQKTWTNLDPITGAGIGVEPTTLYDYVDLCECQHEPCMVDEIFRLRDHLASRQWCTTADFISLGLRPRGDREFFPTNEPWILRNLSNKQLVRAEAIALKPEFIHGPYIDALGFGEVLLSRVCWSSAPAVGIEDPTNICRGVWAAHRFDITTLARHQRQTGDDDDWVDVSDEVAAEIATIWRSNFGADWREFLCESV